MAKLTVNGSIILNTFTFDSPNEYIPDDYTEITVTMTPTEVTILVRLYDTEGGHTERTDFFRGNFTETSGVISGEINEIQYGVNPALILSDLDISVADLEGSQSQMMNAIFGGDDSIRGSTQNDKLYGFSGDDLIYGNGGVDLIDGGTGADIMVGGAGNTVYYVDNAYDAVVEFSGGGTDFVRSSVDHTLAQFVDNLTLSGAAISGTGNGLNNIIEGTSGKSILFGMDGDDRLYGNGGDDVLWGGYGSDILNGGLGIDTASYSKSTIGLTVSLHNKRLNTGEAAGDSFNLIENITGSAFDDILQGDAEANSLDGRNGNDRLHGGDGVDTLIGGAGNDLLQGGGGADALIGGAGTDTANYAASTNGVTASMSNLTLNTGDAKGDTYSSIENLTGSAFADYLYGNSAANTISTGSGNDQLNGGAGNDKLIGGAGDDVFIFSSAQNASTNVDTISDFNVADDAIWLSDAVFKGLADGVLSSAAFRKGAVAADSSDRIIYDPSSGKVSYDADGAGGKDAVQFALLAKNLAVTQADFFVF